MSFKLVETKYGDDYVDFIYCDESNEDNYVVKRYSLEYLETYDKFGNVVAE